MKEAARHNVPLCLIAKASNIIQPEDLSQYSTISRDSPNSQPEIEHANRPAQANTNPIPNLDRPT